MAQEARRGVRRGSKTASVVGRATRGVTFDTGVLIALERRHAGALALLRACRISRASITIPAAVVAEWWRGTHRALLEIGSIEPLSAELAQRAGGASRADARIERRRRDGRRICGSAR
jgi:predicted nucleic acid-binding protein